MKTIVVEISVQNIILLSLCTQRYKYCICHHHVSWLKGAAKNEKCSNPLFNIGRISLPQSRETKTYSLSRWARLCLLKQPKSTLPDFFMIVLILCDCHVPTHIHWTVRKVIFIICKAFNSMELIHHLHRRRRRRHPPLSLTCPPRQALHPTLPLPFLAS